MVDGNVASLLGIMVDNVGNKVGRYVVVDKVANSGDVRDSLN